MGDARVMRVLTFDVENRRLLVPRSIDTTTNNMYLTHPHTRRKYKRVGNTVDLEIDEKYSRV